MELSISSSGELDLVDITEEMQRFVKEKKVENGFLHLFLVYLPLVMVLRFLELLQYLFHWLVLDLLFQ